MSLWSRLWIDFEGRVARLAQHGATPCDAVDQTIDWQLRGESQFVPGPGLPPDCLHLPELFSGAPWLHREHWLAFVTINPSIDQCEIFPTRADLAAHEYQSAPLESFFLHRFEPGQRAVPIIHGRGPRLGPTRWVRTAARDRVLPKGQTTWSRTEAALRGALRIQGPQNFVYPLGRIAAIADIVPWKFAKWSNAPEELRTQLAREGGFYLKATLARYKPAAIVATGRYARTLMRELYPSLDRSAEQAGVVEIDGRAVPWFGTVAPTGGIGRQFYDEMARIGPQLRTALHLED